MNRIFAPYLARRVTDTIQRRIIVQLHTPPADRPRWSGVCPRDSLIPKEGEHGQAKARLSRRSNAESAWTDDQTRLAGPLWLRERHASGQVKGIPGGPTTWSTVNPAKDHRSCWRYMNRSGYRPEYASSSQQRMAARAVSPVTPKTYRRSCLWPHCLRCNVLPVLYG